MSHRRSASRSSNRPPSGRSRISFQDPHADLIAAATSAAIANRTLKGRVKALQQVGVVSLMRDQDKDQRQQWGSLGDFLMDSEIAPSTPRRPVALSRSGFDRPASASPSCRSRIVRLREATLARQEAERKAAVVTRAAEEAALKVEAEARASSRRQPSTDRGGRRRRRVSCGGVALLQQDETLGDSSTDNLEEPGEGEDAAVDRAWAFSQRPVSRSGFFELYHQPPSKRPASPAGSFLQACDRMGLSPRPFFSRGTPANDNDSDDDDDGGGPTDPSTMDRRIDLGEAGLSDAYIQAMTAEDDPWKVRPASAPLIPDAKVLSLKSNSLGGPKGARLLRQLVLGSQLRELDVSNNRIGEVGCQVLSSYMSGSSSTLASLRVANNHLSDASVEVLLDGILADKSVTALDLSHNHGGSATAAILSSLLLKNQLVDVKMGWNKLQGGGPSGSVSDLFAALGANKSLENLDLSFNAVGRNLPVEALCKAIGSNTTLTHLNLDHCSIETKDCEALAAALTKNHKIQGIHLCPYRIDSKGFVLPSSPAIESRSRCWICSGWTRRQFRWRPRKQDQAALGLLNLSREDTSVTLHLSFDDFRADEMLRRKKGVDEWHLFRMCPPGPVSWYVRVIRPGMDPHKSLSEAERVEHDQNGGACNLSRCPQRPHDMPVNCKDARPREKPWFKLGGVELVWQLSCSIYSERQRECDSRAFFDTERLIDAAFLGDVAYSKLDRVVKDPAERAAVLQSCRAYFPLTCSVFRFYCAQAADLQPFSLALNSYTLLMQNAQIPDKAMCKTTDLDTAFIAANVTQGGTAADQLKANSTNTLSRFEFLEILVRIAPLKYPTRSISEAVRELFETCIEPFANRLDITDFKTNQLYRMDTEQAFSPYMDGLKWLHTKFSARKIGVRQKPHMEMKELVYVFAQSCFIEKSFTLQVVHFLFGASRMMVQDEMKETTIHKLRYVTFVDFLEVLARAAMRKTDYSLVVERLNLSGSVALREDETLAQRLPFMLATLFTSLEAHNDECRGKLHSSKFADVITSRLEMVASSSPPPLREN